MAKKWNNEQRNNEITNNGIVLLSVVIILLTIAIIGASLVAFFSSVNISAQIVANEAKALYLAEAGIVHGVNILRKQAGASSEWNETVTPISLGEGTYTVRIDFAQSLITSTGIVHGTSKTVQVQYAAL